MRRILPPEYRSHLDRRGDTAAAGTGPAVTLRSIVIGLGFCVLIAVCVPYGSMLIRGSRLGLSSATPAAFFALFLLLLFVQPLLRRLSAGWALRRGELIVVFFMMMVASAIPTRGVMGMLLPMISGHDYYATPENRWEELVHPHLPEWMVVTDAEASLLFFEGGGAVRWEAWLPALASWAVFYLGLYLAQLCAMVLLRRQWVDRERLAFPMAQVPLAMLEGAGRRWLPPFFTNPLTWIGMSIPLLINLTNGLSKYDAVWPSLRLSERVVVFGIPLDLSVNFLILGFSYLIGSSVSMGLWVFFLLHQVQDRVFHLLGIRGYEQSVGDWSQPGVGHEMTGALAVLVLFGLWTARGHLRQVLAKAFGRAPEVDDSAEILSYRAALLGLAAGVAIMSLWLWRSGLPPLVVPLVVAVALVLFIGLARVIAESGLPTVTPAMIPAGFVLSGVGAPALGPTGLVALGYSYIWTGDFLVFMSAPLANGLRLSSETGPHRRRISGAVALAMAAALVVSCWFLLDLAHQHGGINLHSQYFKSFATRPADFAAKQLIAPVQLSTEGWIHTGAGATVMSLLFVARQQLPWWPLHPIGYPVAMGWAMQRLWFPVFLAWAFKVLVLRFGGARTYARSRPLFLGMALGQIVSGGLWLLVDGFTGKVGNVIPVY